MNDLSSLGENSKAIHDKRGLNLNDVSELAGISEAMLSKIERGESAPTITTAQKIVNRLKITLNALASEVDSNYAVRDIIRAAPLIDDNGLFTLYNISPSSPLNGVQVFYDVFRVGYHYSPLMFTHESSNKECCIASRGELGVAIGPKTYYLFEGCGIDSDAHEEHGHISCGMSEAVVRFLLIQRRSIPYAQVKKYRIFLTQEKFGIFSIKLNFRIDTVRQLCQYLSQIGENSSKKSTIRISLRM